MISAEKVARIKACNGLYSIGDTAKYFGVTKGAVHHIWTGKRRQNVQAASEAPNVISTRISPSIISDEARTLIRRGSSIGEAAQQIGVSESTVRRHVGGTSCFYSF